MSRQIALTAERPVAFFARERLLASVQPQMGSKITTLSESLVAIRTLKWLEPNMRPNMYVQMRRLSEVFETIGALMVL